MYFVVEVLSSNCVAMCGSVIIVWFFFQAEDGIRDLVRSRGLGDVYKRQGVVAAVAVVAWVESAGRGRKVTG